MSKYPVILYLLFMLAMGAQPATAQCSICSRTTQQLGERPAKALNIGIIYLAFTPLAIFGVLGYRWWKSESHDGTAEP
jgi:hypothetical protein